VPLENDQTFSVTDWFSGKNVLYIVFRLDKLKYGVPNLRVFVLCRKLW